MNAFSGMFMTGDPSFAVGQSRLEHFVTSCDRGRYVRYPEQYRALLQRKFPIVDMETKRSGNFLSNAGVLLKARAG